MKYLLDTNICIYIIKNNPLAVREHFLRNAHDEIAISSIVVAELAFGAAKSQSERSMPKLMNFLASIQSLAFDDEAAFRYGKLRTDLESLGTPIGPLDTQIAAHALALDCVLVTNNEREFNRVPGLKIENWIA